MIYEAFETQTRLENMYVNRIHEDKGYERDEGVRWKE
jgi:hypothetical protein